MTHKTCPACGERLEATVKLYLTDLVIEHGKIVSFDVQSEGIGADLSLYCANDHTDIEGALLDSDNYPDEVVLYGRTIRTD